MASTLKHLRSSTADKRPTASGLVEGQLAINTASGTPGLFFKDSNGGVVKVGPAHVGVVAPNAVPAGSAGNSKGELWVDENTTTPGLKYYTGSTFVNLTPSGTTTTVGLVELATPAETQAGSDGIRAVTPSGLQSKISDSTSTTSSTTIASSTAVKAAYDLANAALPKAGGTLTGELLISPSGSLVFEGSSDDIFETTLAVVNPTADRTITFPNITGTVVTTGDIGTVTSTMILDGTVLNDDINASAAIAGTKISPDFGNQNVVTTGTNTAASFIPTGSSIPTNGVYLPAANSVGVATNGTGRLFIDSAGLVGIGTSSPAYPLVIQYPSYSEIALTTSPSINTWTIGHDDSQSNAFAWRYNFVTRAFLTTGGSLLLGDSPSTGLISGVGASTTLQVQGSSNAQAAVTIQNNTLAATLNAPAFLHLNRSGGADSNNTVTVINGDRLGQINFNGTNGTTALSAAAIYAEVDGIPGANDMPGRLVFSTTPDGTGSPTERMRIDSTGKVGIGTSSPAAFVDIAADATTIRLTDLDTGLSSGELSSQIEFYSSDSDAPGVKASIQAIGNGSIGSCDLAFSTGTNTERMRIDSTGKVGIGTTSINASLEVSRLGGDLSIAGLNASTTAIFHSGAGAAGSGAAVVVAGGNTSPCSIYFGDTDDGDIGGIVYEHSSNSMGFRTNNVTHSIFDSSGNLGLGRTPTQDLDVYRSSGNVVVQVDSDSLADTQTAAFRALGGARDSDIGVYKHSGITNPCAYIHLDAEDNAANYLWVDNSNQFRISTTITHIGTTSGTVVGTQTSDERLKDILGPVEYGLDTLKQLEPVRYALKSEPDTEKLGFIAQQVLPLVPQSVFDTGEHIEGEPEDAPTKLGMEYVSLIPVLVNAIKELSAEVDALKARITTLES